jgi:hypothetical protein
MATNYKRTGAEAFDTQFKAIGGSSPRPATGFKVGGTDIANLFFASTGGDTTGNTTTGFKISGGIDVSTLFRNISYIAYAATLAGTSGQGTLGLTAASTGSVTTKYKLTTTGTAQYFESTGAGSYQTISGDWLLAGSGSDYSVRWNHDGGYLSPTSNPGTENTWIDLSADREWTIVNGIGGVDKETRLFIEIAATSDTATVLASVTVIMHATRT